MALKAARWAGLIGDLVTEDNLVIAERAGCVELAGAADAADHLAGAEQPSGLPELTADSASGGMHQHLFAGPQPRDLVEHKDRGGAIGGSSGGPRQRLRVGTLGQLGDQAATVHDGQGGDGPPDLQTGIGDPIADAAEVAGDLDAWNERQRDVDDTATVEDLSVVGTGEGDVDGHLTRTGHGGGHVGEGQDVGIAETGDRDGTHGQRASPLDQDASSVGQARRRPRPCLERN